MPHYPVSLLLYLQEWAPSRIFSPSMVAFSAFEESCLRLICAPGLLSPVISRIVVAFAAVNLDLRMKLNLFYDFDLFDPFRFFPQFGSLFFRSFAETAAAKKCPLARFLLGPQYRTTVWTEHFRSPIIYVKSSIVNQVRNRLLIYIVCLCFAYIFIAVYLFPAVLPR